MGLAYVFWKSAELPGELNSPALIKVHILRPLIRVSGDSSWHPGHYRSWTVDSVCLWYC